MNRWPWVEIPYHHEKPIFTLAEGEPRSTATSGTPADTLTAAKIKEMFEKAMPPLYYAIDYYDTVKPGEIYWVKAGKYNPEFILVHPQNFEQVQKMITWRRLVHIREYVPDFAKLFDFDFNPLMRMEEEHDDNEHI